MAETDIDRAATVLKSLQLEVHVLDQNRQRDGYFAGPPSVRARAVHDLFRDPNISGIVCVKGGYGTTQFLDQLDFSLIAGHPKILVGYSDVSALLLAVTKTAGFVTFHGPMLLSFVKSADPYTLRSLRGMLFGGAGNALFSPDDPFPRTLRPGVASGPLIGGNLTSLTNLLGTPFEPDTTGAILFIEDIDEELYRLERMLLHLRLAGKLDRLSGLVIGEMVNIRAAKVPIPRSFEEIVLDVCAPTTFPIAAGFPCGHGQHQVTLPLSAYVELRCGEDGVELSLLEPAVSDPVSRGSAW